MAHGFLRSPAMSHASPRFLAAYLWRLRALSAICSAVSSKLWSARVAISVWVSLLRHPLSGLRVCVPRASFGPNLHPYLYLNLYIFVYQPTTV